VTKKDILKVDAYESGCVFCSLIKQLGEKRQGFSPLVGAYTNL